MRRSVDLADILLFLRALPLSFRAQKVRSTPIPQVVAMMVDHGTKNPSHSEERLILAAVRATSRWSRWFGGLDTCLVRSLVIGALLSDKGHVVLHLGFRPGETDAAIDGHAWVTLDGRPVGADGQKIGESYSKAFEVSFRENNGGSL